MCVVLCTWSLHDRWLRSGWLRCRELNSCPLEEPNTFLTAEPSLQPQGRSSGLEYWPHSSNSELEILAPSLLCVWFAGYSSTYLEPGFSGFWTILEFQIKDAQSRKKKSMRIFSKLKTLRTWRILNICTPKHFRQGIFNLYIYTLCP